MEKATAISVDRKASAFFLFITLLAVAYIANGHYSDKTIRNINTARTELKQLQYRYKILKAEVMYRGKESEVVKAVEQYGLKRLMTPPVVLKNNMQEATSSNQ